MLHRKLPLFKAQTLRFFRQQYETEDPLHAELFSPEQMQNYGKTIAQSHRISHSRQHQNKLLDRLEENEVVLEDVRDLLNETIAADRKIVPAGDWLLDNFYLIENIISTTRRDLPRNYSRELPRLQNKALIGMPRVYAIAIDSISHGDGHVDAKTLPDFINAYQSVSQLKLGELWAIPIMLRLALIENLRRLAIRILKEIHAKDQATLWADRIIAQTKSAQKNLILLVADMARSKPVLNSSFVAEFSQRLSGKSASFALPLAWIEQQLAESNLTIDALVQLEIQQQTADQISISNTIGSLRSLDANNWKEFVEATSIIEATLRKDPSGDYTKMDFTTRDNYRHVVEKLAKHSGLEEQDIALFAIHLAQEHKQDKGSDRRLSHVGYYLFDNGLQLLKKTIHTHAKAYRISGIIGVHGRLTIYGGSMGVLSALIAWLFITLAQMQEISGWELIIIGILSFIGSGSFSSVLVNWIVTLFVPSHTLPRMDFSEGIPSKSRTLVIVPAMLSSKHDIELLTEALEVRFLANQDKNLFFGLLTDFLDAKEEKLSSDTALITYAQQKIQDLNTLYKTPKRMPFFLFHRDRKWNSSEKRWIGYERKRGKLADLNALILEGKRGPFSLIVGSLPTIKSIKYVITLDTDTTLPRDSAKKLAGTMAHPLNRPQYNLKQNRIIMGHALLQPRVTASLSGVSQSIYSQLIGDNPGLDPYTSAISDVYQDLFSEGSFIGKGIYDVVAFQTVLKERFPENSILSHDLLEGCYTRSGLVSDIQLFEDIPGTYRADVDRRQRWIRGDWQSFQWLLPFVATKQKKLQKNILTSLSKWKILDNLRRSITSIVLMSLFAISWSTFKPLLWTLLIFGLLVFPPLLISLVTLLKKPYDMSIRSHLISTKHSLSAQLSTAFLNVVCLPHDAYFSFCAIMRTCWRMTFSHRHLLQWNPSETNKHETYQTLISSIRFMWIAPTLAITMFLVLLFFNPKALLVAAPFLLLWACSPGIVWKISKPISNQKELLTQNQKRFIHRLSRKTWAFFETFVTATDNWLPPDNFQEIPAAKIAHRTSPTNIGLSLLSNLGARDLGYISEGMLLERTNLTMQSMESLETYKKHFYNWYDTITLQPLLPRYISTVDSGNLVAHLMTLHAGLLALSTDTYSEIRIWEGLEDTNTNLQSYLDEDIPSSVHTFQEEIEATMKNLPKDLTGVWKELQQLHATAQDICIALEKRKKPLVKWWSDMLLQQCNDFLDELEFLSPWLSQTSLFEKEPEFQKVCEFSSLRELYALESDIIQTLDGRLPQLRELLSDGHTHAEERFSLINKIALQVENFTNMDFSFLYNKRRNLFTIGYSVDSHRKDSGYYDLLASEARLSSFVAIAQEQVPKENWFSLGRLIAKSGSETLLYSWSGSMFEYLMPLLIMPSYKKTLLGQTCAAAVRRQIEYGNLLDIPWGISESGYSAFDASLNYRYHAFGVPGLGLKRELHNDVVITPYATALSLLIAPKKSCQNLLKLSNSGFEGAYGLYEAIDYTKSRLLTGQRYVIVQSFMAHHQGMSFLSFVSQLKESPMQKRFESIPMIRATNLLLEEKIPRSTFLYSRAINAPNKNIIQKEEAMQSRSFSTYQTPQPEVHLLSSETYHVMITNAGGGYSKWKKLALTRWHEDITRDNWGTFVYIRNEKTKEYWSNTFQPTLRNPEKYEVIFSEGLAEFQRRDNNFDTCTEIAVSPEDPIELRRLTITNRSSCKQIIDITSYAEVVLANSDTDAAHPSFSNLFIQTEIAEKLQTILCSRRPRSATEQYPCMFHLMMVHKAKVLAVSYETDRMKFIGRGNTLVSPKAMQTIEPLSGTQGSVLDPIVAIRQQIEMEPEMSVTIDIITGIGDTKEAALQLAEKYQEKWFTNRVFELSKTHCQIALRQINSTPQAAQFYEQIAGSILYANAALRCDTDSIRANHRGQSGLWGYSISGDLPIVLFTIHNASHMGMVKQLVQAHSYWHQKGLEVDLIILHQDFEGYRHELQEQILAMVTTIGRKNIVDQPGGIFIRAFEQLSIEDQHLLKAVSRIVLDDNQGSLKTQIITQNNKKKPIPKLRTLHGGMRMYNKGIINPPLTLQFFNGIGGFSSKGTEYVITVKKNLTTPAPWSNVIANPDFGTVLTESGTSYTWMGNAHEFRLSPWYNDPVKDTSGEALYIRDEESGQFWSPTSLPHQGTEPYVCRHGFGYSTFEHTEFGINSNLTVFVAKDASIKFMMLTLRNDSDLNRKLSVTNYTELVLGNLREKSAMHVVTESQSDTGAIFAQNWYNTDFAGTTVFLDASGDNHTITGDRTEFIGRNGTLAHPEAMTKAYLSGSTGPAYDPCAAIQVPVLIEKGKEVVVVFKLGAASNKEKAQSLVDRFKTLDSVQKALKEVRSYWQQTVSVVQIDTPDIALNTLTNGWLMYQMISSRLWGRSGFYQSGGAFGFRDQLQDSMALVYAKPTFARAQIVLCASRQFKEGDVQHWWHPPMGRGVRTHISDDYLWLPLTTCRYISLTGDISILDEMIPFIEGPLLKEGEESSYDKPEQSKEVTSLYDHCVRSLLYSSQRGVHGLPLMGSGDWNDGMNMVGIKGKGESVWLGFFLYTVLMQFSEIAIKREDYKISSLCAKEADELQQHLNHDAWDGSWYKRAWFDDGSPLGCSENTECKIDSLAQSWSVLSKAGDLKNSHQAMNSVYKFLVNQEHSFIKLLDPPFDTSTLEPGYIKGYVPGVRENGGQYTHAAIWTAMAFAQLGETKKAWELCAMINPIEHGSSPESIDVYQVDPYVMAADIYSCAPHEGRGGWTWYTGSASWMYRFIVESLLGFNLSNNTVQMTPLLPPEWKDFKIHYRFKNTMYHITVVQIAQGKVRQVSVDGKIQQGDTIILVDDHKEHNAEWHIPKKERETK